MRNFSFRILIIFFLTTLFLSCQSVDNERIPNMAVNISLSDAGMWNTYGVAGFGSSRNFIYNINGSSQPAGFPYKIGSATGFGGVLLIEGIDAFNPSVAAPLAYDLACPVERKATVRVYIDTDTYVAVCKECHSTYDVTMGFGAPISGEAVTGKFKYALRRYNVIPSGNGGYYITN